MSTTTAVITIRQRRRSPTRPETRPRYCGISETGPFWPKQTGKSMNSAMCSPCCPELPERRDRRRSPDVAVADRRFRLHERAAGCSEHVGDHRRVTGRNADPYGDPCFLIHLSASAWRRGGRQYDRRFVDATDLEAVASLTVILADWSAPLPNLLTWWPACRHRHRRRSWGLVGAVVVAAGPAMSPGVWPVWRRATDRRDQGSGRVAVVACPGFRSAGSSIAP